MLFFWSYRLTSFRSFFLWSFFLSKSAVCFFYFQSSSTAYRFESFSLLFQEWGSPSGLRQEILREILWNTQIGTICGRLPHNLSRNSLRFLVWLRASIILQGKNGSLKALCTVIGGNDTRVDEDNPEKTLLIVLLPLVRRIVLHSCIWLSPMDSARKALWHLAR